MFLIAGLLAALIHARTTGEGQIIDAAVSDGEAYLMSFFYGMMKAGSWKDERASNLLDGGAPFYDTYRCADGEWVAIGSIEPQFYAMLLKESGESSISLQSHIPPARPRACKNCSSARNDGSSGNIRA